MILREWRGRASASNADAYSRHFRDQIEYLVLTRWQSMDAVRRFAGAAPDKAVVEPGAVAALVEFDSAVHHYVVIDEVVTQKRNR